MSNANNSHEVTLDDVHIIDLIRTCDHGQNCRYEILDLSGKKSYKSTAEASIHLLKKPTLILMEQLGL